MGFFDLYSIVFLVIAVVIFWKLRSVLGTRNGEERPPVDRFAQRRSNVDPVVPLRGPTLVPPPVIDAEPDTDRVSSPLDDALRMITRADRTFDQAHFLAGAKAAYEMIVTAFAHGDRKALQPLLSKDVFNNFDFAISERERLGQIAETKFVGIERAEIVEAHLNGNTAEVTVRFLSHLITATMDRDGAVIEGDANRVTDVTDVWRFARDVTSSDPNWHLVATDSG
jgi:predicted lipid-binding transport protein (Tim44 family)